jgi:transposase
VRTVSNREEVEVTMDAAKPMVRAKAWVGVDVGKEFHWAVVVDAEGEILLSRRVENEEADLSALVEEVLAVSGGEPCWAVDQPGGGAALLLAVLWGGDQRVLYIPGLAVDRARDGFRGETKTDRRDALVIAEQARMRRDLKPLEPADELLSELRLLLSHRRDLVADQSRALQRIRDALLASFPGLERALPDMRYKGALQLLCRYQTPRTVLRSGRRRIETYLKGRGARNAASLAGAAVAAAKAQSVVASAEGVAASIVAELAGEVLALKERISALDAQIEARFRVHPLSGVLTSLPGMGALLGAEFLATVGDPRDDFASADQLAAFSGLAPAARDSGKRTGNDRRMRGGNRRLKQVFYQAAFASLRSSPQSRAFYDRKRAEGKRHNQALIALARRRVNVLWAMLRDGTEFDPALAA